MTPAKTIGFTVVACWAALAALVDVAKMMSDPATSRSRAAAGSAPRSPPGEPNPELEVLVLPVAEDLQPVAKSDHRLRGAPAVSQDADPDWLLPLRPRCRDAEYAATDRESQKRDGDVGQW